MDFISYSRRLDYLLELIEHGGANTPKQLAKQFNCCDKTARNMINKLREKGHKIAYSKGNQKYYIIIT